MGPDNGKKARRPPLTGLDKRVFEILWMQLTEDPARIMDELPPPRELIDMVRGEDPTLRRQKALLLENCVNRVVPHLRQRLSVFSETMKGDQDSDGFENADSGSDADDNSGSGSGGGGDAINRNASFSDLDQKSTSVPLVTIKPTNSLNKSLTRFWANNSNPPKAVAATAAAAAAAVKTSERPTMQAMTLEPGLVVDPKSTGETSTPATPAGEKRRPAGDEKGRKRRKNKTTSEKDPYLPPPTRLKDLGGVEPCIEEILELIVMPMRHPEIYLHTGVQPPRGVLLHGPPGCGKTMLANAIAGELGVPFIQISAPSVVSGMSGESEKKLRDMFQEAKSLAPCLVFIDEIDAITPKRETAQREMERRIVAQLLTCMDDLSWDKTDNKPVMMIGATNRPDSLDPALRRAGRFDREIAMGVPDDEAREKILRVLCRKLRLAGDFDYAELAKRTPGYVGADLNALTTAAGMIAVKRIFHEMRKRLPQSQIVASLGISDGGSGDHDDHEEEEEERMEVEPGAPGNTDDDDNNNNNNNNEGWDNQAPEDKLQWLSAFLEAHPEPLSEEELAPLAITNVDFVEALKKVQPSAQREGFATVPGVTWQDIGALDRVRDELRMAVVEPIKHPEFFARVGITAPSGVLLWGPPGCGKTLLAKAVANESHTNFISVKGPELLNKYVGESERAVRQVFARARASSPCVVFFDELDALCSRRDEKQSEASARVVNTLLTELDGVEGRKQVYVIAATNRPDMIDPAMLRPGRLDKLLYVELPTAPERYEILRTLTKRTPLDASVDLREVASHRRCEGYSGADLASLVREAAVAALRSIIAGTKGSAEDAFQHADVGSVQVSKAHFEAAFANVPPSVSRSDMERYEALRELYASNR